MPGQYSANDLAPTPSGAGQFSAADIAYTVPSNAEVWKNIGSGAWEALKNIPAATLHNMAGFGQDVVPTSGGRPQLQMRDPYFEDWANDAEKKGHSAEATAIRFLGTLPFASEFKTILTGSPEERQKTIGSLGVNLLSLKQMANAPEVSPGAIVNAAKSVVQKAGSGLATSLDVITNPVAKDVAGIVSPRAAHVMSLAERLKRIGKAVSGEPVEIPPAPELTPTTNMTIGPQALEPTLGPYPGGAIPTGTINVPPPEAPTGMTIGPRGRIAVPTEAPSGTPATRTPLGLMPQVTPEAAVPEALSATAAETSIEDLELLNKIAQGYGKQSFKQLDPRSQATVRTIASRIGANLRAAESAETPTVEPQAPVEPPATAASPEPQPSAAEWLQQQFKPPPKPLVPTPDVPAELRSYDEGSAAPLLEGSESKSTVAAAKLIDALRSKGIKTSAQAAQLQPSDWWQFGNLAGVGKPNQWAINKAIQRIEINPEEVALPSEYTSKAPQAPVEVPSELEDQLAKSLEQVQAKKAGITFESVSQNLQDSADAALERVRQRGTFSGTKLSAGIPVDDLTDMAIWGAAKMAKGTINFAQWSKEMLADIGNRALGGSAEAINRLRPLLRDIYDSAAQKFEHHLATAGGQLPNLQKVLSAFRQGKDGMEWYTNTQAELNQMFGPDAPRFLDFLAATSARNTVAGNVTQALKAYLQWKNGQSFQGFLPAHIKMMNEALAGQPYGGLKVSSFNKNLMGDPIPVTVDMWMSRFMGFGDAPTEAQYKLTDYLLTQVALKKGIEPRQLQAAIWRKMLDEAANAGQSKDSFETVLKRKLLKDPDLAQAIERAKAIQPAPARPVAAVP